MRRFWGLIGVVAIAGIAGLAIVTRVAQAKEPPTPAGAADAPSLLAVAIGSLQEDDGETAIIDLRAGTRDGKTGGNLRFYSPDDGYYNGAVRTLSVEGTVIHASGSGGLIRPDGTRVAVHYDAAFHSDTNRVSITVTGRKGLSYTLEGKLSPGVIRAAGPKDAGR